MGGFSTGLLLSFGGVSLGGIAVGGVAMGLVAFGGVSFGLYALGGAAGGLYTWSGSHADPEMRAFIKDYVPESVIRMLEANRR
jgi:hypothetical protein